MTEYLDIVTLWLHRLGPLAYLAAGIFAFLESLLFVAYFLPGVVVLAFVGFLCSLHFYSLTGMVVAAYLGHFSGELANYYLGRHGGRPLFQAHNRFLHLELLDKVESRFHQNALRIMIVGKFIGLIRPLVSFTAGMVHYSFPRFFLLMLVMSWVWAWAYLGIGYLLGTSWSKAPRYLQYGALVALVGIAGYFCVRWILRRRTSPSPSP